MGFIKVLRNYLLQLFVQNVWNFKTEQSPGMRLVLSFNSKKGMPTPPRSTFNTNPYLASYLSGVILKELRRGDKSGVSATLESSLAFQGDDLYWRVLRPVTLIVAMILVIFAHPSAGIIFFLLAFNILAQGERFIGFSRGVKKGRHGLKEMFINIARIKKTLLFTSALLVGFILSVMFFPLEDAGLLILGFQWYWVLLLLSISLIFSIFRLSPLFNFAVNLVVIILLEVVL